MLRGRLHPPASARAVRACGAAVVVLLAVGGHAAASAPVSGADPVRPQLTVDAPSGSGRTIAGLDPADIASAYGLSGGLAGATVGVVISHHDPQLESDLAVYRSEFGLPPCSSDDGCLRVVNQDGHASPLPSADAGWATEESLDVQAVSAACPDCRLLVVEADSSLLGDAGRAVNTAVALGAAAVSNSYGAVESASWSRYSSTYFTHPGVPIVAAAGDGDDARAIMPASLPNVIAVGGTSLEPADGSSAHVDGVHRAAVAVDPRSVVAGDGEEQATTAGIVPLTAVPSPRLAKDIAHLRALRALLRRQRHHAAALTDRAAQARTASARTRGTACTTTACRAALARSATRMRHLQHDRLATSHAVHRTTTRLAAAERAVARDRRAPPPPTPTPTPTPDPSPVGAPVPAVAPAPAAAPPVTGWTETAWSGGESGCSAVVAAPSWQSRAATGCGTRSLADVAAVADPSTGLAVYDTAGHSGWIRVGGTSLAAPLVTGMLVRSGAAPAYSDASRLYARAGGFRDVTSGTTSRCWVADSCTAGPGYDLPTGVGAPKGLDSF